MNNEKFTESFSKRLTFHNGRSLIAPTFHVSWWAMVVYPFHLLLFYFFFSFFFLSFSFFVFSSNSYPFSFSIFTRPILLEQKSLSRSMEVDGLLGVSALILLLHSLNWGSKSGQALLHFLLWQYFVAAYQRTRFFLRARNYTV